jgi:hypothetical protein
MTETSAFDIVEPIFQTVVDRVGAERWIQPDVLRQQPAGVRMLLSTRAVDGLVANSGWVAIRVENQLGLLPLAAEGYDLLGLESHAEIARRASGLSYDADDDEPAGWSELDEEWFELPDADEARAAYIRAHPEEFRL